MNLVPDAAQDVVPDAALDVVPVPQAALEGGLRDGAVAVET